MEEEEERGIETNLNKIDVHPIFMAIFVKVR
jgi:hypothetical protein